MLEALLLQEDVLVEYSTNHALVLEFHVTKMTVMKLSLTHVTKYPGGVLPII